MMHWLQKSASLQRYLLYRDYFRFTVQVHLADQHERLTWTKRVWRTANCVEITCSCAKRRATLTQTSEQT